MSHLCIYHGNCADGFSAAWVVRKALGNIEFYAGVYQNEPPPVKGKRVVLVDFSYKRPVMERLIAEADSLLVLDHHKTAEEDLRGLPGVVFDMNKSGATLTWDHYFPADHPPPLLAHIEDRDLWRFALPRTREIQANVFSYPYDFAVWDELMASDPAKLAEEGSAIERKHHKDVAELVAAFRYRMNIGGVDVPVANLPYTLTSDAGHLMAQGEPFAACYWDTPEGRVFSLRSQEGGADVSEIAKKYGGGGHKHASGFRLPHGISP